jgi:hypothetical protein
MGGDITFTVEKSYDKRYRRAVRVMIVPWVYSIVMLEDGKEILRSDPKRDDYFFGVSRRDTNGINIYRIVDFISNGIIKYYQESSNTELRDNVYRKLQPIHSYIVDNIIDKKLKGNQVVEALTHIFNILKGAVTDADPDVDLKRFGTKILNGMNGINEPRDPSTPVSDSTAATTSSSDVVSGDAGASGHTRRDLLLMIAPNYVLYKPTKLKINAGDLDDLKRQIEEHILGLGVGSSSLKKTDNIEISRAVPPGTDPVPVPFKTLDEIQDKQKIQIHRSVQGGYRENPKRKKRKNTMRKKRKNTMRKKRKNTKRKNTKRKNTKRKNTKKR